MPLDPTVPARIVEATQQATDAFWETIVQNFPEINTGDLTPPTVFAFDHAVQRAVAEWYEVNVPGGVDEEFYYAKIQNAFNGRSLDE